MMTLSRAREVIALAAVGLSSAAFGSCGPRNPTGTTAQLPFAAPAHPQHLLGEVGGTIFSVEFLQGQDQLVAKKEDMVAAVPLPTPLPSPHENFHAKKIEGNFGDVTLHLVRFQGANFIFAESEGFLELRPVKNLPPE